MNSMIPGDLERHLTRALVSKDTVFAFERDYLEATSSRYSQDIALFCERLDRPMHQWLGSELSEVSVAQQLVRAPVLVAGNAEEASAYRSICTALTERETGVFCIYDAEEMTRDAQQLTSQLIHFVKDHELRWQFLVIGNLQALPQMTQRLLQVDQTLPEGDEWPIKRSNVVFNRAESWPRSLSLVTALAVMAVGLTAYWLFADRGTDTGVVIAATEAPLSSLNERALNTPQPAFDAPVTPMMAEFEQALQLGDLEQIKRLIEQGSSINSVNAKQMSGLIMAAQASDGWMVRELLSLGARYDLADNQGNTALAYACHDNKAAIVSVLLAAGADPNQASILNKTPLTIAASNGNQKISAELINRGAEVNHQDQLGWSPLFYAAWNDDVELTELLLESGASNKLQDTDGYTAADIARIRKSKRVGELLN